MKYYDSTSMKVQDTEDGFVHAVYNEKAAKVRNILALISLPIMAITVLLQFLWLNIVLHCILCSTIIVLSVAQFVCDILQKDRKNAFTDGTFILIWGANMVLYIIG